MTSLASFATMQGLVVRETPAVPESGTVLLLVVLVVVTIVVIVSPVRVLGFLLCTNPTWRVLWMGVVGGTAVDTVALFVGVAIALDTSMFIEFSAVGSLVSLSGPNVQFAGNLQSTMYGACDRVVLTLRCLL